MSSKNWQKKYKQTYSSALLLYRNSIKMKNAFLLFTFLFSILGFGQAKVEYALIDSKISKIPQNLCTSTSSIADYINANFKTENDKIRAVFYWTASNISYDVANMLAPNSNQTIQEKITATLKTKKGVCIHYAEVFNEIANKVGVKSIIIDGYTKQDGKIATLSHAWCAVKTDNKWYLCDPTWGSGSITNGKFVRKINNYFFKTDPSKIISSHIPFDYLWQFSNYPITNQDFLEGKTQLNKSRKQFDFEKEISKYEALSETDKLFESAARIEKNGVINALIYDWLKSKKEELASVRQNLNGEKLNAVVAEYNQAILGFNDFIYYRNNKFKPTLPDDDIKNMIVIPKEKLAKCQNDLYKIGFVGDENSTVLSSAKKSVEVALAQAEEQMTFVNDYLSKGKSGRKSMFTKLSWFGIPLN